MRPVEVCGAAECVVDDKGRGEAVGSSESVVRREGEEILFVDDFGFDAFCGECLTESGCLVVGEAAGENAEGVFGQDAGVGVGEVGE